MESLEGLYDKEYLRVPVHTSVYEAANLMSANSNGALLVIEGVKVVGIFSERDLMTRVIATGKDPMSTTISQVMTPDLLTVSRQARPTVAIELMHRNRIRHLPITDDSKKIVGLVSLRCLLSVVIKNLASINRNMQEELDQLRFLNM